MTATLIVCWALCGSTVVLNVSAELWRRRAKPARMGARVQIVVARGLACAFGALATASRNVFLVGLFAYFAAFPLVLGVFVVTRTLRRQRAGAGEVQL